MCVIEEAGLTLGRSLLKLNIGLIRIQYTTLGILCMLENYHNERLKKSNKCEHTYDVSEP